MASESPIGTGPVAERLARVKGQLKRLGHSEAVMQGKRVKYRYTPTDDIKDVLRPLLAAEGVAIIPINVEVLDRQRYEVEKRGDNGAYVQVTYDLMVKVYWRISAGESNFETAASIGRSLNQDDKDPGAASTYAYRNLVAAVFDLSTGEDHFQEGTDAAEQSRPEPKPAERRQTGKADTQERKPARSRAGGQKLISDAQLKRLHATGSEHGWPEGGKHWVYRKCGVRPDENGELSSKGITSEHYDDVVAALGEPYPPFEYVRDELDALCGPSGLTIPEANDALREAGFNSITDDIVGKGAEVFQRAHAAVLAAADQKAGA
jgi:hypothetical protein